jgi:SAM-dependent methyltransferase
MTAERSPTRPAIGPLAAIVLIAVVIALFLTARAVAPEREADDPFLTEHGPDEPLAAPSDPESERQRERFPPSDLVLLEGPDREEWQNPDQIMSDLGIADGDKVADVGAGSGWFTIRLAERVGPRGKVYAQDLQPEMVTAISRRVKRLGLSNVEVVQGREDDPNLPTGMLDAVLVVDVYPEVDSHNRQGFLRQLATALKPRGRLGIVNYKPGGGGPGPESDSRVSSTLVEQDARAAGLDVISQRDLGFQYLIVLQAPQGAARAPLSPRPAAR